MDLSLPGSSVHGIFQARVLEWGAIAFSDKAKQLPLKRNQIFQKGSAEYSPAVWLQQQQLYDSQGGDPYSLRVSCR